jgi:hypothetical protein
MSRKVKESENEKELREAFQVSKKYLNSSRDTALHANGRFLIRTTMASSTP